MSNLTAALEYAARGYEVLPVRESKAPYTTHGVKDATLNPEAITKWWNIWPHALIGIRCSKSFGYVLDVDVSGSKVGDETLKELEKTHGKLPLTLSATTASGGRHFVFTSNNPNLKGIPGFARDLDFRSTNNYIIVAPSQINGKPYEWDNDLLPAPLPNWLEDLLENKASFSSETLRNAVDAGFEDGTRNDGLFRKAASLMGRGVTYPDAKQLLFIAAQKCNPPIDENETINCLNSAYGNDGYTKNYRYEMAALADRFSDDYKTYTRFMPLLNQWIMWNNRYWEVDNLMQIQTLARSIPEKVRAEIQTLDAVKDERQLKQAVAFIKQITNFSIYSKIPQHAAPQMAIHPNDCNADDYLIGLENGVLNLKTKELITGNDAKNLFITYHGNTFYDPTADSPRFLKFLNEIFGGDQEIITYMQRFVGYTLTGSSQERALLILHGNGSNGKSLFLKIIQDLMGSYSRILNASVLMKSKNENASGPDANISSLAGRRFIITSETGNHQRLDENLIKQLTGDEKLSARAPYAKEAIEFDVKFKIFMATNHKPYVDDADPAIWSRIKMIPFTQRFLEAEECTRDNHHPIDKGLYHELVKELPGILNWAVRGCLTWQRDGLQEPNLVKQATQEFRSDSDILNDWLEDFTTTGLNEWAEGGSLFNSYNTWCINNSTRPMSRNSFGRRISEIEGVERGRTNNKRGFTGISVKPLTFDDDPTISRDATERADHLTQTTIH